MVVKCTEFPNDNPALWSDEAVVEITPTERMEMVEEADADAEVPIEIVDEFEMGDEVQDVEIDAPAPVPVAVESPPPAPEADPFATLVRVMQQVAGPQGAACVAMLLGQARVEASAIDDAVAESLVAAGLLERASKGLARSEAFTNRVLAWQGILRGESEDFDACGTATLDEWAADVIARVVGNPARVDMLRRELRSRGVAAFGLVEEAA